MKFKDYPYERPNLETIKKEFTDAIRILKEARFAEEQIAAVERINQVRNNFQTMAVLCNIRAEIDTTDEFYDAEQNFFDENRPLYADYVNEYSRALYESPFKKELTEKFGNQLFALIEANLKSFSSEIIEDLQEENKLVSEYRRLAASAKIPFDGKINNLSQMGPYHISSDRNIRREAEKATMGFFAENEAKFDEIYDKLVKVRTRMAKKLGFENYIPMGYLRLGRTDYDAEMVATYRNQVARDLVPVAKEIIEAKGKRLGIKDLKSYDLGIDFASGNPKPVGDRDYLVESALKMYTEMSKETGEFFKFMVDHELMDLEAKKGKAGGGFCTYIAAYRSPFIFSNFNGTSVDVVVLTHEAGHAFQVYCSRDYEVPEYVWPTLEACEVHSMSMEFFAWPWMELFFGNDADRYRYLHLAGTITFIPYGVLVDHFQHEVYANPEMTPAERKATWRRLEKLYLPYKVYENEFLEKGNFWLRQSHIFSTAFYYIDYTLAQVAAQQYWIKDQKNHQEAWESYLRLCKEGGSKSFLELLEVAGLDNPFLDGTVKKVADKVREFLDGFDQSKLV
ncbi:MAG TPA: M3 family oligoendopeptidase [Acholeplasmataceae bacterium]|jgi:M3 family oligoendopeptidase|nr:M3 family oligoendopeptidase [Acholeplasmataceae bacterium]